MPASDARAAACRVLETVLDTGRTLDSALERACRGLEQRDRAFAREVASGALRYYFSLCADLGRFLRQPIADIDTPVLGVLLVGAYQIRHMRVPGFAAVNESVELARHTRAKRAGGLINAVLRKIVSSEPPEYSDDDPQQLEARYDHPRWLIEALQRAEPEHWRTQLEIAMQRAPMVLRVDARRIARDAYLARLAERGIEASAARWSPVGVRLATPVEWSALPGSDAGLITVQDEGAQLVSPLLRLAPGLRVLDACAAPGNKTRHLLELEPHIDLVACEVDERRAAHATAHLRGAGHDVDVVAVDVRAHDAWWDGRAFDRILLDAPCSGTGTLRRHPDIKVTRSMDDVARHVQSQRSLLDQCWRLLQPGGTLLYCTCSLLAEENIDVVHAFAAHTRDVEIELPSTAPFERGRLLAEADGTDGYFVALLHKRSG